MVLQILQRDVYNVLFQDSCSDKVFLQNFKAVSLTFCALPPRPGSNRSLGSTVNEAATPMMER